MVDHLLAERLDGSTRIRSGAVASTDGLEHGDVQTHELRRRPRVRRRGLDAGRARRRRACSPWSCMTFGNTMTSIAPARSSRVNTAIRSPFFVYLRCEVRDDAADGQRLAVVALEQRRRRAQSTARRSMRLGAHERVVAHVQPEHLLLEREPLGLVELEVGDRDPLVEGVGRRRAPSPNRLITPWSRSRRRASVMSTICSKTDSRPWRGCPSESNAPALMSDSIARLLSTGAGRPARRSRRSRRTAPFVVALLR